MDIDSKLFVGHCQQQVSLLNTYDLICKAISDNQPADKKEDMTEVSKTFVFYSHWSLLKS